MLLNSEKFLNETIQSVIISYENWELILVDNGSMTISEL